MSLQYLQNSNDFLHLVLEICLFYYEYDMLHIKMDELLLNDFFSYTTYLSRIYFHIFSCFSQCPNKISVSIKHYKTKYLDHNGGCRCIDTCKDALLWEGAILSSNAGKFMISFNVKFWFEEKSDKLALLTHILEILHCSTI